MHPATPALRASQAERTDLPHGAHPANHARPTGSVDPDPRDHLQLGEVFLRVMSAATAPMYISDEQGRIVVVNEAMCAFVGRQADDLCAGSAAALAHPDDVPALGALVARVERGEIDEFRSNRRYIHGDGRVLYAHIVSVGLRHPDGRLRFFVTTINDMTGLVSSNRELATERELGRVRARYEALVSSLPVGMLAEAADGTVREWNPAAVALLGIPEGCVAGREPAPPGWWLIREDGTRLPVEDRPNRLAVRVGAAIRDAMVGVHLPSGEVRWMLANAVPSRDEFGSIDGVVTSFADVTALRRAEREARATGDAFRVVAENASEVVFRSGADGRIQWISPSVMDVLGYSSSDLLGRRLADLMGAGEREAFLRSIRDTGAGRPSYYEGLVSRADGGRIWIGVTVRPQFDESGAVIGRVGSCRDVTTARNAQDQLAFLATHDELTRALNRRAILQRLEAALRGAAHADAAGAAAPGTADAADAWGAPAQARVPVLFLDMRDLKGLNDRFGHLAGDAVIATVAQRARLVVGTRGSVGRYGGDEFVVVLSSSIGVEEVEDIARRLIATAAEPLEYAGLALSTGLSVGIAYGSAGDEPAVVLNRADAAGYRSKRAGQGEWATYDPEIDHV